MSKKILIDASNPNETRVAATDKGKLDDFEIESNKKNAVKGDVYLENNFFPKFIADLNEPYVQRDVRGQTVNFVPITLSCIINNSDSIFLPP